MSGIEVRIVELEPMRVAISHGFGPSPEEIAWTKILDWGRDKGLLADLSVPRFFGFNNPDPSPGSPNYGYEQWMTVPPDAVAEGEIKIGEIPAGRYAVTRCTLEEIGQAWRDLVAWVDRSRYKYGPLQCLEEAITYPEQAGLPFDQVVMDIYISIVG